MPPETPTRAEELANTLSHGVGLLGAVIAVPFLVVMAVKRGDVPFLVGGSIFATTVVLMYLTSTIYHALPQNRLKRLFQVLDHVCIFLLIAGTYTPFTLGVLRGAWGWTLLGLVWSLALVGILLKVLVGVRHEALSTGLYLLMGWLAVVAAKPLLTHMAPWGLFWLAAGGVSYTVGVFFFVADRMRYNHFIWHLFVMAGTACHFIAVYGYAA